jgi:toxin ParE1/3/4
MAEYRFSPAAQRDLDIIFDYTVTQWGLPQAMHYIDSVEVACLELAQMPGKGQDCIAIVRILHQRMDALLHL